MTPIEDMTPEEIQEWMDALEKEMLRRQNLALFQEKQTELHEQFRNNGMLPKADFGEWEKPEESVDAYGVGDVVTRNGKVRRAKAGMVVCETTCDEHWEDAGESEDEPEE